MHPRKIAAKELASNGYASKRTSGGHEIFYNPELKTMIVLKTHDFNDNDLKYIRKEIRQNKERAVERR